MELLLKLLVLAVVVPILSLVMKKSQPEIGFTLSILAAVFVIVLGNRVLSSVIHLLRTIVETTGILPEVLNPMLKVVGIAVLTKISVDISKESGCLGLSSGIELIGNALAITVAAPLLLSMLTFLRSI